ncbi:MAG: hypothetical protein AABZ08_01490 [Planctomycetota bacterium]
MRPDVELLFEREEIARAWAAHGTLGFPPGAAGLEFDGITLALFCAELAGCIESFVKDHKLKPIALRIIESSDEHLKVIIPKLNPVAREYFEELESIVSRIISFLEQAKRLGLM